MIEITIASKGGEHTLARILIENLGGDEEHGNYSVAFVADRAAGGFGIYNRYIENFPRLKYNVLALLLQALNTLDPKELELEHGVSSSDLARRQRRALPALPGEEASRVHHHRSPFRRGQPEQHGSDGAREEIRPEDRQ